MMILGWDRSSLMMIARDMDDGIVLVGVAVVVVVVQETNICRGYCCSQSNSWYWMGIRIHADCIFSYHVVCCERRCGKN